MTGCGAFSSTSCGVSALQFGAVSGEIDHRCMQSVTNTKIGHFMLSSVARGENFAFEAPAAKTTGHEHCGRAFKQTGTLGLQCLRIDIIDVNLCLGLNSRMGNGFDCDLYASSSSRYLPTKAILTSCFGASWASTTRCQSLRSASGHSTAAVLPRRHQGPLGVQL